LPAIPEENFGTGKLFYLGEIERLKRRQYDGVNFSDYDISNNLDILRFPHIDKKIKMIDIMNPKAV